MKTGDRWTGAASLPGAVVPYLGLYVSVSLYPQEMDIPGSQGLQESPCVIVVIYLRLTQDQDYSAGQ